VSRPPANGNALILLSTALILVVLWLTTPYGEPATVGGYAADLPQFRTRLDAQAAAFATGRTVEGTAIPLVRPPAGDVYVLARRWEFEPALELAPGKSYRLHILAEDAVHSAVVGSTEVLLSPDLVRVVPLTTPVDGKVRLQCGEYCGLGHTRMIGTIEIR
jgi:cytochrome c oxidase subunit 2